MCTLDDGTLVRISRTQGSDTFQVGAAESHGKPMDTLVSDEPLARTSRPHGADRFQGGAANLLCNDCPSLATGKPHPLKKYTVHELLRRLLKTNKLWKFYFQADCHVFAQRIFEKVTGQKAQQSQGQGQLAKQVNTIGDDFV